MPIDVAQITPTPLVPSRQNKSGRRIVGAGSRTTKVHGRTFRCASAHRRRVIRRWAASITTEALAFRRARARQRSGSALVHGRALQARAGRSLEAAVAIVSRIQRPQQHGLFHPPAEIIQGKHSGCHPFPQPTRHLVCTFIAASIGCGKHNAPTNSVMVFFGSDVSSPALAEHPLSPLNRPTARSLT